MNEKIKKSDVASEKDKAYPLSVYDAKDDIYNKEMEVPLEDGEPNTTMEGDLDISGAELDDTDESIGEEDEENNLYSIGGDDHNDLEEGKE
jgi:hypothetical protein